LCSVARIGSLSGDLSGIVLASGKALMAQGTSVRQHFEEPSYSTGSTSTTGGPVTALSPFPYGVDNAAMSYFRSMRFTMSSYAGLFEHHLYATLELLMTTSEISSIDSVEDSDWWAGTDFSRLCNPEGLRQFMGAYDYLFGCPDSDEEDYDPSHECFHMEGEKIVLGDATPVGQGANTPLQQALPTGPPRELAAMSTPVGSWRAELEQLCELKAKISEDCQQLVHLQATLEQERSGRGDGGAAWHRARDVNCCINNDEGGD
jgi:hypothetical protein